MIRNNLVVSMEYLRKDRILLVRIRSCWFRKVLAVTRDFSQEFTGLERIVSN